MLTVRVTTRVIETGCVMELSTIAREHDTDITAENTTGVADITDPTFGTTGTTKRDIRTGTGRDIETVTMAADLGITGILAVGFRAAAQASGLVEEKMPALGLLDQRTLIESAAMRARTIEIIQ